MTEIICTFITAVAGIIVALLGVHIKKVDERSERQAQLRQKESLLSMRMTDAILQLSIVTANALTGGKNNGNVEAAKQAAKEAAAEYREFLQEVTARQVGK